MNIRDINIDTVLNKILWTIVLILSILIFLLITGTYSVGFGMGDSMKPMFNNGSFMIYEPVDNINTVEEGDIIWYKSDCKYYRNNIVHMVIDKRDNGLITMGINNEEPDQEIYYKDRDISIVNNFTYTQYNATIDNATYYKGSCQSMIDNSSIKGIHIYNYSNNYVDSIIRYFMKIRY